MGEGFLPFPRGQTVSGININKGSSATPSSSFLNKKGEPLINALLGESERGQVLIAAAFLDKALRGCLAAKFAHEGASREFQNRLLGRADEGGDKAILGTFGARIPVCRAFGLIGEETYVALCQVQKIRNAFAHKDFKIAFASQEVKPHAGKLREWLACVELKAVYDDPKTGKRIPSWKLDLELGGEIVSDPASDRHVFLGATIMLYMLLANVRWGIRKEEYDGAIQLVANPTT